MRIAPMIRRRTRQNQTSRFRWDRWADALPLGFAYADRFTCPRLPVAILRLRHKGCTAMKKALYGIVTQRLTDDLWSTTSHELDPPMAIRSTGICPIHLVLNKRNRSFSRISMTRSPFPWPWRTATADRHAAPGGKWQVSRTGLDSSCR